MAESIMVLKRKADEEEEYSPELAYDEAREALTSGDELNLKESGWIYPSTEAGEFDFFDGSTEDGAKEIIDFAKSWGIWEAKRFASIIMRLVSEAEKGPESADEDVEERLVKTILGPTNRDGYEIYSDARALWGYPDYGIDKIFADDNDECHVRPSDAHLRDILEHPENYFLVNIVYHG